MRGETLGEDEDEKKKKKKRILFCFQGFFILLSKAERDVGFHSRWDRVERRMVF